MSREREFKFSLPEFPDPDTVQTTLTEAGFTVQVLGTRVQNDTYFDTLDGTLEHAGLTLRIRETPDERLVTLKVAGEVKEGFHDREELELPLPNDDWPEAIRARLEPVTTEPLAPHLLLHTTRTRYLVLESGLEAELSLDEVTARRPEGQQEVRFLELEIEARAGSDEDLRRVAEALKYSLTLTPESLSKPKHAQILLGTAESK